MQFRNVEMRKRPKISPGAHFEVFSRSELLTLTSEITKDTNRKIRKTEFIYICGSKNGSIGSTVITGEF